jgi:quinol monooxygenase YgiN
MIRVVAVITAKPGRREEILAAFRANVPAVRAEKGCIEYAAHIDATGIGPFQAKFGPDIFAVIESWRPTERRPGI